jgi:hypothetical protein
MHRSLTAIVLTITSVAAVTMAIHAQIVPTSVRCLHQGGPERQADRVRREQAIALMKAINVAQGQALQQTRNFKPLSELSGLPGTPDGFRLRMYVNDGGYVASLKDSRDPCYFGIFSDESAFVYTNSPLAVPFVASAN